MKQYMTLDMMRNTMNKWEAGVSGFSWFGTDNDGKEWHAYVVEDDDYVTYVDMETRDGKYLTTEEYEEMYL